MKKDVPQIFIFFLIFSSLFGCTASHSGSSNTDVSENKTPEQNNNNVIIGYNQNWSFLPSLNDPLLMSNIKKLSPKMLRYPGGTITHKWNWREGKTNDVQRKSFVHPLGDVQKLIKETGAKLMIDLDVVHSTLANQIEMLDSLQSLGVPIEYLEMGNELYSKDPKHNYASIFPDGDAYAALVGKWVPALKARYPKVKIAALLIAKTNIEPRMSTWNRKVSQFIDSAKIAIDAYTYHLYIGEGSNFNERIADFNSAKILTPGKEIWITEYGNMNEVTDPNYYTDLSKMADYFESNFSISLSHTLIGNKTKHAKLEPSTEGREFTVEGQMFLKRVAR